MNSVNLKSLLRIAPYMGNVGSVSTRLRLTKDFAKARLPPTARLFCNDSDDVGKSAGRGRLYSKEPLEPVKNTTDADLTSALDHKSDSSRATTVNSSTVRPREIPQNLKDKFVVYRDKDAEIILDVHEEMEQLNDLKDFEDLGFDESRDVAFKHERNLNYARGATGVFDLEDLVEALKAENGRDICVIKIPKELLYCEYFVIVSGMSKRHIHATASFIKKLYKRKKSTKDVFVIVQGEESDKWLAVDMGNIVLHIFSPEERAKFDIETLWTVGSKFDENCRTKQTDIVNKYQQQLSLLNSMHPATSAHDFVKPQ